jgi:hypothetical protein
MHWNEIQNTTINEQINRPGIGIWWLAAKNYWILGSRFEYACPSNSQCSTPEGWKLVWVEVGVTTLFTSFIGFKKWQGLKENVCHGRKRLNTIWLQTNKQNAQHQGFAGANAEGWRLYHRWVADALHMCQCFDKSRHTSPKWSQRIHWANLGDNI